MGENQQKHRKQSKERKEREELELATSPTSQTSVSDQQQEVWTMVMPSSTKDDDDDEAYQTPYEGEDEYDDESDESSFNGNQRECHNQKSTAPSKNNSSTTIKGSSRHQDDLELGNVLVNDNNVSGIMDLKCVRSTGDSSYNSCIEALSPEGSDRQARSASSSPQPFFFNQHHDVEHNNGKCNGKNTNNAHISTATIASSRSVTSIKQHSDSLSNSNKFTNWKRLCIEMGCAIFVMVGCIIIGYVLFLKYQQDKEERVQEVTGPEIEQ